MQREKDIALLNKPKGFLKVLIQYLLLVEINRSSEDLISVLTITYSTNRILRLGFSTDEDCDRFLDGLMCRINPPSSTISISDFAVIRELGRGLYSHVCLVQLNRTGQLYAMKSMEKEFIRDDDEREQAYIERLLLISAHHPFLVQGHWAFQTDREVHMVMDYVPGGRLLERMGRRRFTPDEARLYIAQIMIAIEYLHSEQILYRGIKPENVLIDENGYIRLCDFGTMKIGLQSRTWKGTAYYQPPEMIRGEIYDARADWWSIGILLYEMVTGAPPYFNPSGNTKAVYDKILSPEAVDLLVIRNDKLRGLLGRLLQKDPDARIANFNDASVDPFFEGFNWKALLEKQITMPFVPEAQPLIKGSILLKVPHQQECDGLHFAGFTLVESAPFPGRDN